MIELLRQSVSTPATGHPLQPRGLDAVKKIIIFSINVANVEQNMSHFYGIYIVSKC